MGVSISHQPPNEGQPENKKISYGLNYLGCVQLICLFPCCLGLLPNTAYHTLVFNKQKKQIEKYYDGFSFAVCFPSQLQLVIDYNQIISIESKETIKERSDQGRIYFTYFYSILIKCRDSKIYQLDIPEEACNCCCDPYCDYKSCSKQTNKRLSHEIANYWRRLQQNVSHPQLMQVGQMHPN